MICCTFIDNLLSYKNHIIKKKKADCMSMDLELTFEKMLNYEDMR